MPNWVSNTLTGPTEVLKQLLKSSGHLDFNIHVPMPMELRAYWAGSLVTEEQQAKQIKERNLKLDNQNHEIPPTEADEKRFSETYGVIHWHDWAVKNWGTKWCPDLDELFEDGDDKLIFQSAHAPPLKWLDRMSQKFPDATFNLFWEEEQGFGQIVNVRNGWWQTVEEWGMPEFEDYIQYPEDPEDPEDPEISDVGTWYIYPCSESGGREDSGKPTHTKGKFYIDMDSCQEYDSLEDAQAAIDKWIEKAETGNEAASTVDISS